MADQIEDLVREMTRFNDSMLLAASLQDIKLVNDKLLQIHKRLAELVSIVSRPGEKNCRTCRRLLPIAHFGPDIRSQDGRSLACKDCVSPVTVSNRRAKGWADPEPWERRP